ncbi:hypothetical protein [Nitrosomonas sp. Nm132]|uniref:PglD-related sugar-binding protein n=1 Tax=Nitrosomonas sp. Nm132 TaxID=1881053 RepID=UPI00088BCBBA|nr:hypothetical protein [Nitrosomonas sp. Nm132]SDH63692.1 sugar O-acyltransferase, sialic acid O-acetyltransferase NeuD family [Nitrosomonas sp. Nm132]
MSSAKPILIYGASEFGKVVKDLAGQCGFKVLGFVDDWNAGSDILGPWSRMRDRFPQGSVAIALAVGYRHMAARLTLFRQLTSEGYSLPALIHPRAYVRDPSCIGAGSLIMAGAVVDTYVQIGPLCVLWPGAVINHDSQIGGNCFISPNATICGAVTMGESCFIGAGAVVVDHIDMPASSFVKAGTVYHLK